MTHLPCAAAVSLLAPTFPLLSSLPCRKIAATVKGLKRGYPGLDLVIL
jgi:hypothetical protein